MDPSKPGAQSRSPMIRGLGVLIGLVLLVGLVSAPPAHAASAGVPLNPGSSGWAKISGTRTTAIASAAVTIPSAIPVTFGFQFRAGSTASGYRARLTVTADGSVSGSFTRVASGSETMLGGTTPLGIHVRPGQVVHLEAVAAAKKTVRLYLRAWLDEEIKPPTWQLTGKDSSSRRIRTSGRTYLWAEPGAGTQIEIGWLPTDCRALDA